MGVRLLFGWNIEKPWSFGAVGWLIVLTAQPVESLWANASLVTGDGCSGIGSLNGFDVYSSARAFGAINTVRREERLGERIRILEKFVVLLL